MGPDVLGSGATFVEKNYTLSQVLIADDTEFNRYALRMMLEKLDISVCEVDDGEEAVKQVKSRHEIGQMFKLIIMDVEMPIKNGWEATEELIALKEAGEIPELCPIIGHTAFTAEEDLEQCIKSGMLEVLPKPPSVADLVELKRKYVDVD